MYILGIYNDIFRKLSILVYISIYYYILLLILVHKSNSNQLGKKEPCHFLTLYRQQYRPEHIDVSFYH